MIPLYPRRKLVSSNGMQLTQGLFYEYRFQGAEDPVYTLKDYDWEGCRSMYKIYMDCESEYEAALKLLGSWPHWKKLCNCAWFKPYLDAWREEREIREAALGKKVLIEAANEGNVTAAKELANQIKTKGKVGRPSKKDKENENKKMSLVDQKVVSLLERAGNVE